MRDALFAQRLLGREQDYEHEVGHCDRTGDRIEPLISLQWFMHMDELAAAANAEVRSGRVRFHPAQPGEHLLQLDGQHPAVVHLAPAVVGAPDPGLVLPRRPPDGRARRAGRLRDLRLDELERDPDVLDTWFSSALWPFATIGWPDEDDPRLQRYYPGDVLTTAREIINLWVARMLMMGIEFMGEFPFTDVVINSTILAADGRRMSKSLRNGVDPLELVTSHGADATRYGLLKMSSTQDVRFSEGMIAEGAKFANKLWNAARFVVTQADTSVAPAPAGDDPADRWVRSRLAAALEEVLRLIDALRLLGGGEGAVRVRVRLLRLVHRGGQAAPAGIRRGCPPRRVGQPALDARADPGA